LGIPFRILVPIPAAKITTERGPANIHDCGPDISGVVSIIADYPSEVREG
jgi:hypothetical protein